MWSMATLPTYRKCSFQPTPSGDIETVEEPILAHYINPLSTGADSECQKFTTLAFAVCETSDNLSNKKTSLV